MYVFFCFSQILPSIKDFTPVGDIPRVRELLIENFIWITLHMMMFSLGHFLYPIGTPFFTPETAFTWAISSSATTTSTEESPMERREPR